MPFRVKIKMGCCGTVTNGWRSDCRRHASLRRTFDIGNDAEAIDAMR
jgi:hypothetical protein